jgi:hypothetical protein
MKKILFLALVLLSTVTSLTAGPGGVEYLDGCFDYSIANDDGVMLYYKKVYEDPAADPKVLRGLEVVVPQGWDLDIHGAHDPIWSHEFPYQDTVIRVPVMAMGMTVIGIGDYCFREAPNLKQVVLPNTITYVGNEAFESDTLLKELNLPESIEWAGLGAFQYSGFEHISIPASAANWDMSAFQGCPYLTQINFAKNLTSIPERMFFGCDSLETVTFPEALDTIGLGAFSACSNLKHITLPEGLIDIQMGAFINAPLEELTIPSTVRSIGAHAFTDLSHMSCVTSLIMDPAGVAEEDAFGSKWGGEEGEEMPPFPALRVPKGTKALYQADAEWSKFSIVEEEGEEGIEQISQESKTKSQKLIRNGQLVIERDGKSFNALGAEMK